MMLFLDTETFCEVPINNGTFAYVEQVETMIISYALEDGPVQAWDLTSVALMPVDLKRALADDTIEVVMHNSMFDRNVLRQSPGIDIPLYRIHDTMARARAHSLPGGLGKLCEVLGVSSDESKDKIGKSLIQLFCKPRPKNSELRRATKDTHPKEWAQFIEYAKLDISAMRVIYKKLPRWNFQGFEREFWGVDAIINQRGVGVDMPFIDAAINATEKTKEKLSAQTAEATNNAVQKTTQRDRLLEYIETIYGIKYDDLTASMVDKAINDEDTPPPLKHLLILRAEASTTSTAKYKKFKLATSSDNRLRGMFEFCGAARTGRFSGRVVQLQNLPRPTMPPEDIELGIEAIKAGVADLIFPSVMSLASNGIRGVLVPSKGKKFVVADLSNIEGRVCAWLAGENWKLKAFQDYDADIGPDLYKLAYARAFRIKSEEVDKYQRQIGKVMELMLQYAGGVGAFVTGANAYGIDLEDLAERAWDSIPKGILSEAQNMWEWAGKEKRRLGLSEKVFVVCDSLKRMWRAAHPAIVRLWADVEAGVQSATTEDKAAFHVMKLGKLQYHRNGAWIRIVMPSGRSLCYPSMRFDDKGLSYSGVNPYSRQWGRISTYSGKLVENITQATARDVLVYGIMNAEKAGYSVVLHAHDELICEVPDSKDFTAERLSEIMTTGMDWTAGMPLAAAGFECKRYRKAD